MARSMGITEQEMHGAKKEIHKVETYNLYLEDAMAVEIQALGEHCTFIRVT